MGVVRSETMIWRIFATLWAGPTGVQRKALLVCFVRDVPGLYPQKWSHPPPPPLSLVLIFKFVKVLCFDTLLQVLILNNLFAPRLCRCRLVSQELQKPRN